MKSGNSLTRLLSAATAVVAGGIVSVVLGAPAPAAAAALPDLKVSVTVTPDKATYALGDAVTLVFSIKNVGGTTATNVQMDGGDGDGITHAAGPTGEPFDAPPGTTHTVLWPGTIDNSAVVQGYASGGWAFHGDNGEANDNDNAASYHITVPGGVGSLKGKVFVDVAGTYDGDQPGLAGAKVVLANAAGDPFGSTTTDSKGEFAFAKLPAGDYRVNVDGWTLEGDSNVENAQVKGGETSDIDLPLLAGGHNPESTPTPTPTPTASHTPTPTPSRSTPPALPVTGDRTGLMFAIGGAVLVLGAAAVVIGRRRRNKFVA